MEPEEIEKHEFLVSLRGYDREEVDSFMRQVAEEVRKLQQEMASAPASPAETSTAPGPSDGYKKVGEETSSILLAAEQVGEDIKKKAQREAAELLSDARRESGSVSREAAASKQAAEADLKKLGEARVILANQLEDVRRRLDETIARLQAEAPAVPSGRSGKTASPVAARPEAAVKTSERPIEAPKPAPSQPTLKPVPQEPRPAKAESAPPVQQSARVETPKAEPASVAKNPAGAESPGDGTKEPEIVREPSKPVQSPTAGVAGGAAVADLLEEIRREREEGKRLVEEALAPAKPQPEKEVPPESGASKQIAKTGALQLRTDALGDAPVTASRRMKRLLQEEQNDVLDRLRTKRGKGTADENMPPQEEQLERFRTGFGSFLTDAFQAGRSVGGATDKGEALPIVENLITKQLVNPLRTELTRAIEGGLDAQDTLNSISERANDVFRVWKGVRTELLGEGMVYAAFHQGLIDAWKTKGAATKRWVLSSDEQECPRDICKQNAAAGTVAVKGTFASGHLAPPAHGGCTCTIEGPEG